MRKRLTISFFFGFLAFALFGCGNDRISHMEAPNRNQPNMNTHGSNTNNGNSAVSNQDANLQADTQTPDTKFISQAALGGMAEVELGRLAVAKAQNPEVKQFAQKMIDDHSKANNELNMLAKQKNYTLPVRLDTKHQSVMDRLNGLSGAEFDSAYVDAMIADHEETVALFKSEAEDGRDTDVKGWAVKTLPNLQMHLEMIKGIRSKMK